MLQDILTFLAQCCEQPQFALVRSSLVLDVVLGQLQQWHNDGVLDRLISEVLAFANSYCSNCGRLPDLLS